MRWFRMYSELLDDPKISEMNDRTFKIFVFLLCLSCECEANGVITMSKKDICWRLRIAPRHLDEALTHLFSVSILGNDNRGIHFLNWDKRQFRSDCSTERVKRFRNVSVTVNETPPEQSRYRTETEQITTSARNRKQNGSMLFDFATRKWSGIEKADMEMWVAAYPSVNIQAQLAKAADWLVSNPDKKKTRYRRFLSNWFSRCQDRGGDKRKKSKWFDDEETQ